MNKISLISIGILASLAVVSFGAKAQCSKKEWTEQQLDYCSGQIHKTLSALPNDSVLPRSINAGDNEWTTTSNCDWTSGFWPGILWYNY